MQNKGVTLVELLITIVILSIVAAVTVTAVDHIFTDVASDTIHLEINSIEDSFNYYCAMEGCNNNEVYQAVSPDQENYIGEYLSLTTRTTLNDTLTDIVIIHHKNFKANLLYYSPQGVWYIEDAFGYQQSLIEYNPFGEYDIPSFMDPSSELYQTLLTIK